MSLVVKVLTPYEQEMYNPWTVREIVLSSAGLTTYKQECAIHDQEEK